MRKELYVPEAKTWVAAAINDEQRKSPAQLWNGEPGIDDAKGNRLKRIRFLRRYRKSNAEAVRLADRLEECSRKHRCFSGACPECGHLLQRAWVRESGSLPRSILGEGGELVALSLVLPNSIVPQGNLKSFDVRNMQRRLKSRLDDADIDVAIGGIDFSFNEDEQNKYSGFWCPHAYVIVATQNRRQLAARLDGFTPSLEIPHPTKVTPFKKKYGTSSFIRDENALFPPHWV
jgi:hypothetical protein